MAYPTDALAVTLRQIDDILIRVKSYSANTSASFTSGGTGHDMVSVRFNMLTTIDQLNTLKTAPGLAQYAKDQKNNQALDIVVEFAAVIAAMQAVADNITSTFPADGAGYILREKWDGAGPSTIPRTFTAGNLVTLRGLLDVVVASIN